MFVSVLSHRKEHFTPKWKGDGEVVHLRPILVHLGLCAIEAAVLKNEILNWGLHCTFWEIQRKRMDPDFECRWCYRLRRVPFIGSVLQAWIWARRISPYKCLKYSSSTSITFLLLNYKDNLKIWVLYWAMRCIHRKGEPPQWWNQPMPKRKVIGRKDRVDEKIDSFPLNRTWCVFYEAGIGWKKYFFNYEEIDGEGEGKYVRDQGINKCLIPLPSQIMRKFKSIPS